MITVKRFTAAWCGPCKQLAPIMGQVQSEMSNIDFQTIDVDASPDLAVKYNVSSIPALIFEKDGQEVKRILGVQSKSTLISILNSL
jgi:thioredoxin 1